MVESNDIGESAYPSPELCDNRHAGTIQQHGLRLELPPLLDPVDKERSCGACEEVESGQARQLDSVVVNDPFEKWSASRRTRYRVGWAAILVLEDATDASGCAKSFLNDEVCHQIDEKLLQVPCIPRGLPDLTVI